MSCMSEPIPPVSRSLTPGTVVSTSARFLFSPAIPFKSTATALNADLLIRLTPVEVITTSSSSVVDGFITMFNLFLSPSVRCTFLSTVSNPTADTINV